MKTDTVSRPRLPLPARTAADTEGQVQISLGILEEMDDAKLILRTMANSDSSFRPFVHMTGGLLNSKYLPRTVLEVVILHMGVRRDVRYEVLEHLVMARDAGVPQAKIDAILCDNGAVDPDFFDRGELLAARFADRLLASEPLDLDMWNEVVELWGNAGGVDLILSVGAWGGLIPIVCEALGLVELTDEPA